MANKELSLGKYTTAYFVLGREKARYLLRMKEQEKDWERAMQILRKSEEKEGETCGTERQKWGVHWVLQMWLFSQAEWQPSEELAMFCFNAEMSRISYSTKHFIYSVLQWGPRSQSWLIFGQFLLFVASFLQNTDQDRHQHWRTFLMLHLNVWRV